MVATPHLIANSTISALAYLLDFSQFFSSISQDKPSFNEPFFEFFEDLVFEDLREDFREDLLDLLDLPTTPGEILLFLLFLPILAA